MAGEPYAVPAEEALVEGVCISLLASIFPLFIFFCISIFTCISIQHDLLYCVEIVTHYALATPHAVFGVSGGAGGYTGAGGNGARYIFFFNIFHSSH